MVSDFICSYFSAWWLDCRKQILICQWGQMLGLLRESWISILVLLIACVLPRELSSFSKPQFSLQCDAEMLSICCENERNIVCHSTTLILAHITGISAGIRIYWFFSVMMVWKQYTHCETPHESGSFPAPSDVWYDTLLMLDSTHAPQLPVSLSATSSLRRVTPGILTTILSPDNALFTLSIKYSINYMSC